MESEWVNVGTDDKPKFEHVHDEGTRHKTDRTIPYLSDEAPPYYRAKDVCRDCFASHERRWPAQS